MSVQDRPSPASVAVSVRGLTKRYGDVVACSNVDLDLRRGEIHGVLGENGAGKSTLMKVLIGLVQPDSGTLTVDDARVRIDSPARAGALGIGMVHQHFSLVDELRVWENVVLGERERLDARHARGLVESIGEHYGLGVDPDARVGDLTAGMRQRVEIIKCLRRDPSIVIFDEPTSVLTPQESEQLFGVLRLAVERENKAVALVSHKLDEIRQATDTVTILRRGAVVEDGPTARFDQQSLAQAMIGRAVSLRGDDAAALGATDIVVTEATAASGPVTAPTVLAVENAVFDRYGHRVLDGLDLDVRAGEIVGIAGVEGNGQVELADVLSSLVTLDAGTVIVDGVVVPTGRAGAMGTAGVGMIPEDRHDAGCVLDMSVAENLALASVGVGSWLRRVDRAKNEADALRLIDEYEIRCSGPDAPFHSLSGGNQQRVVLARELSADPKVLVAAQPTRGLDVGAIEFMGEQLRAAAARGVGVLLISSELEEILHLADRILVLHAGRIVGEMNRTDADVERIGLLMGGVTTDTTTTEGEADA
ncbi:ABC transporter ATP-binding protein [Ilumatobacter nonamiensis]|uniref:ABC transporter ATP-binding protein n=1 Tax=Ilumatobacter nonamiensis TaxID=467093 RepID=UPI001F4CF1BB|nr:ABC transporter ATP-binding protein [Ilumatobacter nonamiensis]